MSGKVDGSRPKVLGHLVAALGIALLLASLPFYLASGLIAPLWAIVVLWLVWLALFVLACLWFKRYPYRVIILPVLAAGIWFGALSAGEAILGWTA